MARSFLTPEVDRRHAGRGGGADCRAVRVPRLEQFLIRDPRFTFNPPEGADPTRALRNRSRFPEPRTSLRGPSKPYSPTTSAAARI